jgi:hypothetical protein
MSVEQLLSTCTVPYHFGHFFHLNHDFSFAKLEFEDYGQLTVF